MLNRTTKVEPENSNVKLLRWELSRLVDKKRNFIFIFDEVFHQARGNDYHGWNLLGEFKTFMKLEQCQSLLKYNLSLMNSLTFKIVSNFQFMRKVCDYHKPDSRSS